MDADDTEGENGRRRGKQGGFEEVEEEEVAQVVGAELGLETVNRL